MVLDVVGLTPGLLSRMPRIRSVAEKGFIAPLAPPLPAVTCSSQATILTGTAPREHGVVGNGWCFRDLAEVWLWRQSNRLVERPWVYETAKARDRSFTCAKMFWWFNMHAAVDWAVTPRPAYLADGRKLPDIWTDPPELKEEFAPALGTFPLFEFWGPGAGIASSRWIADASRAVLERHAPRLALVYLPHLDYDLQRYGPDDPRSLAAASEIDAVAGDLIDAARSRGYEILVLSEYGITAVSGAVHPNRILREAGLLSARRNATGELLDIGGSRAFAVADHQIAHIYVRDRSDLPAARIALEKADGVERVLDEAGKRTEGLDHPRAGELVAIAAPDRWFTYYYWLDDALAPDFARTVDIHKKPGYDPCELFLDPRIPAVKTKIAWTLFKKAMGFRTRLDVIPLDASLVKGSHGRRPARDEDGAVILSSISEGARDRFRMEDVSGLILSRLGLA